MDHVVDLNGQRVTLYDILAMAQWLKADASYVAVCDPRTRAVIDQLFAPDSERGPLIEGFKFRHGEITFAVNINVPTGNVYFLAESEYRPEDRRVLDYSPDDHIAYLQYIHDATKDAPRIINIDTRLA